MPRKSATQVENKFLRGLISEATALNFPENAAIETSNCVFDSDGRVTRRLGIDYEVGGLVPGIFKLAGEAITEFVWQAVDGNGSIAFLVQQTGQVLRFHNISNTVVPSAAPIAFTVDIASFLPVGSTFASGTYPCQYSTAKGDLIVVNKVLNPFYISYNSLTSTFSTGSITLKYRDFKGLEDGLEITERPTGTTSNLTLTNPEHYYNLLNQGWYAGTTGTSGSYRGDVLAQWDAARADLPSNADIPSIFRASLTDIFDNANVLAAGEGNTPAPKGHFILDVGNESYSGTAGQDGFPFFYPSESVQLTAGSGIVVSDMSNSAFIFNTDIFETAAGQFGSKGAATSCYAGKNYTGTPKKIFRAMVHPTSDQGFIIVGAGIPTFFLCGKNGSAPTSSTDFGTILGTTVLAADQNSQVEIFSTDLFSSWDYVYVISTVGSASTFAFVEVTFFESITLATYQRPESICSFAGRVFYSGPQLPLSSNNIYFTQIIEGPDQYGKCYQKNDPTSENFSALLPDDGGVITIAEVGVIKKLFAYQTSIVVFANNGIWLIKGGSGGFAANNYSVRKLSSLGMNAAFSVIDYKGLPLWWAEDGIYTLTYDANYDSFKVDSLTDKTISTFFKEIPRFNRQFVKGAYDTLNNIIYWVYNDTASLAAADHYSYTKTLCLDMISGAFYPWTFGVSGPVVRGIIYVNSPDLEDDPVIKYTTTVQTSLSAQLFTYSDLHDTDYEDWDTYGTAIPFESYFITGYKLHGEVQRFTQPNYVFVYLETQANSGAYLQAIYDFTNNSSSGKWSVQQQIYNSALTFRDVNFRRLKVRGKGRSIQFKFISEAGKPFSIIGWSMRESQNDNI